MEKEKVILFEEIDHDTKNVAPKKKLKIRKARLRKQLGVSWL